MGITMVGLAARQATLVLKNGERIGGTLQQGSNEVTMNVNGQNRTFRWDEVAVIEFQGDPGRAELQQLPGDSPAELESHMIVLRDGSVIRGRLHDISGDGETVTYDPRDGGASARRSVSAGDIARIYLNAPAARRMFGNVAQGGAAPADRRFGRRRDRGSLGTAGTVGGRTITVVANRPWTDTGITVNQGEQVSFSSSGEVRITAGGGPEATATVDGASGFPARGGYPVANAPGGALIGRVGNSAAFGIGSQSTVTMPASGRLSLGINDDNFGDNSGSFSVVLVGR